MSTYHTVAVHNFPVPDITPTVKIPWNEQNKKKTTQLSKVEIGKHGNETVMVSRDITLI